MSSTLQRIRDLAAAVVQPDASAERLSRSLGVCVDPFGRGTQWQVEAPNLPGVSGVTVFVAPGTGAPELVLFHWAAGKGPSTDEVEAVFGAGQDVEPLSWEPWRCIYQGPRNAAVAASVIATVGLGPDDSRDSPVTELAVRRDQR